MDVRDPEKGSENGDDEGGGDDGESGLGLGHLAETERWSTLVDDGHGADRGGEEEEERAGVDGPGDGVLAGENAELDDQVDRRTEASSEARSDDQTGKDGGKTLAA